jgi:hypothetical protein
LGKRSIFQMIRKSAFTLLAALQAWSTLVSAKPQDLDRRWSLEIPDDWWYSSTENLGPLRLYTFGAGSPDPLKDAPVMLVDRTMNGFTPKLIRGISLGVARVPVSQVVVEGSKKFERKGVWLRNGYRTQVETTDGTLLLAVFVFTAQKLPGPPLPNAETRLVMAHIAGKSDEELEALIAILEKISESRKVP